MPEAKEVLQGAVWRIVAGVKADGSCPFWDFFKNELDKRQKNDLWALLKHFADRRVVTNTQKFKHVEGDLFEFKEFQVRVFCYMRKNSELVLTHGTIKKRDRLSPRDIERASSLKDEWERNRRP